MSSPLDIDPCIAIARVTALEAQLTSTETLTALACCTDEGVLASFAGTCRALTEIARRHAHMPPWFTGAPPQ